MTNDKNICYYNLKETEADNIKKSSIKDVAKKAGYSISTVSDALRGDRTISDETRAKIEKAARELNYTPNKIAQALSRNKAVIGVMLPKEPAVVQAELLKGFEAAKIKYAEYNIDFQIETYDLSDGSEREAEAALKLKNSDALIVETYSNAARPINVLSEIAKSGTPIIGLVTDPEYLNPVCSVSVNSDAISRIAAEIFSFHLSSGARLAAVTGKLSMMAHQRILTGFIESVSAFGLSCGTHMETDDTMDNAYRAAELILQRRNIPDGILVTNFASPAVCRCISDMGLEGKVCVIGVDIYKESADYLVSGGLKALIFQNKVLQAKSAADAAFDSINRKKIINKREILVKPEIVLKSNLQLYWEE